MTIESKDSQKQVHKFDVFLNIKLQRMTEEERIEWFTNNNIEIDGKIYYLPQHEGDSICQ